MKRSYRIIGGLVLWLCLGLYAAQPVYAEEWGLSWTEVDAWLQETEENALWEQWGVDSMEDLLEKVLAGEMELSLQTIVTFALTILWTELGTFLRQLMMMAALGVLGYLLQNLSAEFAGSSIGETAFAAVYACILMVLLQSFRIPLEEAQKAIETISYLSTMLIPALITLASASGNLTAGVGQSALLLSGLRFFLDLLENVFLPLTLGLGIVEAVNYLSRKKLLDRLVDMGRTLVQKGLRLLCSLFLLLMGAGGMVLPSVDQWLLRTGSTLASSVPVVGGVLAGAMDTVLSGATMMKNGVGTCACLLMLCFCLLPLCRVGAAWLAYRWMGALLAPISDARVSGLTEAMGRQTALLLSILTSGMILFTCAVGIFIYSTT